MVVKSALSLVSSTDVTPNSIKKTCPTFCSEQVFFIAYFSTGTTSTLAAAWERTASEVLPNNQRLSLSVGVRPMVTRDQCDLFLPARVFCLQDFLPRLLDLNHGSTAANPSEKFPVYSSGHELRHRAPAARLRNSCCIRISHTFFKPFWEWASEH